MNSFWAITGVAGGNFGEGAGEGRYQIRRNPSPPTALKCPRCNSVNTKFCYYNNYNLAQPRYFCKACRRYWTKGGVLRNVPVGGGCRRSKRSSVSSSKCSAGLASEKDLLPSGCPSADGPNSVALVSNPDSNTNPELDFNQATATETPSLLIHEAEIFAETITSPVPIPTTLDFSSFAAPPRISFRSRPMVTGKEQIIAPTRFMHQAAMPIPLDHLLMEAQDDLRSPPGFMDQARLLPPPPIPIQFPQTPVEDVTAQPGFLDQALIAGMRWSGAPADPTIYGQPVAEYPTTAAACWSHGHWDVADPALNDSDAPPFSINRDKFPYSML